ncbi:hypothetical protein ACVMFB_004450 [Bradyrhizobium sp. USDA 4522]
MPPVSPSFFASCAVDSAVAFASVSSPTISFAATAATWLRRTSAASRKVASAALSCAWRKRSRAISERAGRVASARMSPTTCRSTSLAPLPVMRETEKVGLGGRLSAT